MSAALIPASNDGQLDAITLIENDHRVVEGLFEAYENIGADGEAAQRWRIVHSMIEELRLHASMEEQVFYPAVQEALGDDADELVEESLREHADAKQTLEEIEALPATSGVFHERVTALIEEVRHHVDEEEQQILPKLREALDSQMLLRLGEELEGSKLTMLGVAATGGDVDAGVAVRTETLAAEGGGPEEGVVIGDGAAGRSAGAADSPRRRRASTSKRPTTGSPRKSPAKSSSTSRSTKTAERRGTAKRSGSTTSTSKRTAGRTARLEYHVTPTSTGRWAVQQKGAARASATFDRKTEAVARGRELAQRRSLGQLIVHGRDGKIQNEFTYGNDPRWTKN